LEDEIPSKLYIAVAEFFAFATIQKGKLSENFS